MIGIAVNLATQRNTNRFIQAARYIDHLFGKLWRACWYSNGAKLQLILTKRGPFFQELNFGRLNCGFTVNLICFLSQNIGCFKNDNYLFTCGYRHSYISLLANRHLVVLIDVNRCGAALFP
ncbi:Uncharacterised protein [Citrobacter werkmanii]|nr:Uncharacterised protein [Citrobacter werkmanii]